MSVITLADLRNRELYTNNLMNGVDNNGYVLHKHLNPLDCKSPGVDNGTIISSARPDNNVDDEANDDDDDDFEYNGYQKAILHVQKAVYGFYSDHKKTILSVTGLVLLIAYFVYFALAINYRLQDEGSWRLLGFTIFGVFLMITVKLYNHYQSNINDWWETHSDMFKGHSFSRFRTILRWFLRLATLVGISSFIIIDVLIDHPENIASVGGVIVFIIIFFITSHNLARVNWHTVFWGIALQYIFAILILRTQWGFDMFDWLGDRVSEFLEYTMAGVLFVFGESWENHLFVTKVLSIVIFFYTCITVLYYLGVMQAIIMIIGRFLAFCMDTTAAESINAVANIFVSMTEAPLMVRPFLKDMTRSELHAVMTGGFATIAGSVLGAYIAFGVPANHLLSASVMSAPAALALSKLSYPETQRSKATSEDFSKMEKSSDLNVLEAACNGASASLKVCGFILANVIAFLSLLAFLNATLTWFGDRVGIEGLTFQYICSYVLYPVAYIMGVEEADCRKVAELIGVKTFTNEFIAYSDLKVYIDNKHALKNYTEIYNSTADYFWQGDDIKLNHTGEILVGGIISDKSEIIATYALCGFANVGSIGNLMGGIGALAPGRISDMSRLVLRAMICGNAACFLTACIAGLFYVPG